jgi:hypothetical protein
MDANLIQKLRDLETFYRNNRSRYATSSSNYHFNDGRAHAIADLRRDLEESTDGAEFELRHTRAKQMPLCPHEDAIRSKMSVSELEG